MIRDLNEFDPKARKTRANDGGCRCEDEHVAEKRAGCVKRKGDH